MKIRTIYYATWCDWDTGLESQLFESVEDWETACKYEWERNGWNDLWDVTFEDAKEKGYIGCRKMFFEAGYT